MRIAITGSSGLMGSILSRVLVERGDEVIRVIRPSSRGKGLYWDPATGQIDRAGLEGMDAVVHLAGENIGGIWTPSRKRRIMDSRVRGTSLLARTLAGLERPPAVFVTASGTNFYGNHPGATPVDESAPKGTGFLADVVARWEGAATPAREAGIRVVHNRMGLVLARDGLALKLALPVFYAGLGGRLGTGRQVWSWVTLPDVIGAFLHAIDHPLSGPVNVVTPNPVTNAEFTRILAEVVHRPAFMVVPAFVLKLFGEVADELLLWDSRVIPRKLSESGYRFRYPELRPALQAVLAGEVGS